MDVGLQKSALLLFAYCFPLIFAVVALIWFKRIDFRECIYWGLFIIALSTSLMPLINTVKGLDSYYEQTELLNAIEVVIKNQALFADSQGLNNTPLLEEVPRLLTENERKDYSKFRVLIDTYEIFITFLGLALGVNLFTMGLSNKLPESSSANQSCKCASLERQMNTLNRSFRHIKLLLVAVFLVVLMAVLTRA
ncbi:hypothetical protein [Photobacterium halotolerans]|uniref:Uncharacterized protein n=1 Tax=Photobacterium halotolerans TaxID=265726 RepID=A0A0F5VFS4_9GAMM|nr:hypothetical protein [Photobacterium halotolerans]KKD00330.1 hypothetical protein KY46_08825 [Photobacterium halotolerans]